MSGIKAVESPNLPENTVSHVIVSSKYDIVADSLKSLGVHVCHTADCPDLPEPVNRHADMLFCHCGGAGAVIERSQARLKSELSALGMDFPCDDIDLKHEYPGDIALNCCIVGDRVICLQRAAAGFITASGTVVNVRQGYAKCSTCVIDEHSIITDDISIALACSNAGMDVLCVRKGSVRLDGMSVGFVGGCCGKLSKDTLAFCGSIELHDDAQQIKAFAAERGVQVISLFKGELLDVGSILPVFQIV